MTYQPIPSIPSVAPRPNLLTTARPVPGEWRSGIGFRDTGVRNRGAWPFAAGAAHADKSTFEAVGPQLVAIVPTMLYVPLECDEVTARTEEELVAELADEIEAGSGLQLARIMAGSVGAAAAAAEWRLAESCGLAQNPTLSQPYPGHAFGEVDAASSTANEILTTLAGDHPVGVAAALLARYSQLTLKGGASLHVSVRLLPHLLGTGAWNLQGDVIVGPMGSVAIPHSELPGPAGADAGTPTDPAAGNEWMYVTGPVEASVGDVRILPEEGGWNRWLGHGRTNIFQIVAERLAIYRFNPSVVIAAEALAPTAGL